MGDKIEESDGKATKPPKDGGSGDRWKYPIAGMVIVSMLGLVAFVTITTGHIPIEVALPLIAGASAAIFGFRLSDWRGKG